MDGTKRQEEMGPEHSTHENAAPAPSAVDPGIGQPHPSPVISEKDSQSPRSQHRFRGAIGRKRTYRKALYPALIRWSFIMVLVAAMYAVLYSYSNRVVMSRGDKRIFNALVTGLAIGLALLTISFLNHVIIDLRWWMLSRRFRSRRKVQAILHAHSLRQAVILAYSSKRLSLHTLALSWVILLLASQIGLASINLCFSLESNEAFALLIPGNVSIPNLSTISTQQVIKSSKSVGAQQYTANSYGTISLAFSEGDLDSIPARGALFYQDDNLVYCNIDAGACKYLFHETNTESALDPDKIPIKAATDRTVGVSTECNSFPVLRGGDGSSPVVTIDLRNSLNQRQNVSIPLQGGSDQSTFFTDTARPCGRGCAEITILEASVTEQPWLYNCTVTIDPVVNARMPSHELGTDLSQMAAAGIALQGYASASSGAPGSMTGNVSGTELVVQAQVYPAETSWGSPVNGSTTIMAYVVSRFAVGVIAIAAESNNPLTVPGMSPHIGIRVKMEHWSLVHVILILTAVVQLLLGIVVAWMSNWVIVPDPTPVAEAMVLRAMMPSGERGGRLRKGDSGRRGGGSYEGRKTVWIYRDEHIGGGVYDLFMEEQQVAVPLGGGRSVFWWLGRKERRASEQSQDSQTSRESTASV